MNYWTWLCDFDPVTPHQVIPNQLTISVKITET